MKTVPFAIHSVWIKKVAPKLGSSLAARGLVGDHKNMNDLERLTKFASEEFGHVLEAESYGESNSVLNQALKDALEID